jgi:nucleotide-binding universal stress UspA family protein
VVREGQAELDQAVEERRNQASFGEVVLRTGDTRDTIRHVADEVHADLIVMGTHGRRGVSRALLGSIAEMVVRTAPCPVLTVRAKAAMP